MECDDPVVRGSREMLKHVFLNLYLNAVQAIEKRGTIEIETRHSELFLREEGVLPAVEIRFSDDGMGISPDVLEKIFDPLFSTRESGSGLGLASVHRIIQMHGGLIQAENGPAGRTVFTVLLPLAGSDRPGGGLNS
jgi:signal transduction histidine kinase